MNGLFSYSRCCFALVKMKDSLFVLPFISPVLFCYAFVSLKCWVRGGSILYNPMLYVLNVLYLNI